MSHPVFWVLCFLNRAPKAGEARQKGHLIRVPVRLPVIGVDAAVGEGTVPRDTISARKV